MRGRKYAGKYSVYHSRVIQDYFVILSRTSGNREVGRQSLLDTARTGSTENKHQDRREKKTGRKHQHISKQQQTNKQTNKQTEES